LVNGQRIDTPETQNYLKANNYFADINYDVLPLNGRKDYVLTTGNRQDNIRGIEIQGQKYAIDLVLCHWGTQTCAFKINGVNTPALHAYEKGITDNISSYDINNLYEIKVNSISFGQCDNRRFCNLHYEAYDVVNMTVAVR